MEEALRYLNKGYLYSLISLLLLVVTLVFPLLAILDLALIALSAYNLYKGFSKLAKIDKRYAPGKWGLILIFIGTPLALIKPLAPLGGLIAFIGVIEYFVGLWRLSKMKGGELIRYGIIVSALAYASGIVAFTQLNPYLYLLVELFMASIASTLLYLGTKRLLAEKPWLTR